MLTVEPHPSPFDAIADRPASWLAAHIADPRVAARAEAAAEGAIAQFDPVDVRRALAAIRHAGPRPEGNTAQPVVRALMRAWMGAIVTTEVRGTHHLKATAGRPVIAMSNHLSYTDTTATECALIRAGGAARSFADRMRAVAGPKVWGTPLHALATSGLNVLPTAQSQRVGAALDPDAQRTLLRGLQLAKRCLDARDPLLIYPEGTRSRSGRLGPFLSGVRYFLREPGAVAIPIALSGTDRLYPIGASQLTAGPVRLEIGAPIDIDDPLEALKTAHEAIAALLPERHRPADRSQPLL